MKEVTATTPSGRRLVFLAEDFVPSYINIAEEDYEKALSGTKHRVSMGATLEAEQELAAELAENELNHMKDKSEAIKQILSLNTDKVKITTIFETPQAGDEVDNGCGVDFDLSRYAIFYRIDSDDPKAREEFIDRLYRSDLYCNGGIMNFNEKSIKGDLAAELKERDGYEKIWEENK